MASNCKDCDRLQVKPSGTGPPRPKFHQPTMYDHCANFQKFKQDKEDEEFFNHRKNELLKFDPNFTDFNLTRVLTKEEFEQFSTQDIAQFRRQLRLGSRDRQLPLSLQENEKTDIKSDQESGTKSLSKKKSVLALTRTPVQCPISVCNRTIGVTFVLSHFLRDHSEDFGVPCQEIYAGKRSVLIFDPNSLEFQENICLGVLAYGGELNER